VCGINICPWLTRLIASLWVRFPNKSIWTFRNAPESIIRQHKDILKAIKKRDAVMAGALMKKHLEYSRKILMNQY
jgi:DNA-binding GntR family transcriptional regulator